MFKKSISFLPEIKNEDLSRQISTRQHVVLANLDDESAGQLAASTLINHGHTRLAVVTGPLTNYCEQRRLQGFHTEVRELMQSEVSVLCVETTANEAGGAAAVRQIIDDDAATSAIFFLHDRLAIGAMNACRQLGISVPQQLSILGCGDGATQSPGHSALSTIHLPLREIGQNAAERVLDLMSRNQSVQELNEPMPPTPPMVVNRETLRDISTLEPGDRKSSQRISAREKECLQWASRGKTSWEISQILGITESTAIYHLRNATRKLEASNRLHAVAKALKAEIIEF